MNFPNTSLEKERMTIHTMIEMYCNKFHEYHGELCRECSELFEYAEKRLNFCRFGESKPTCEKCPIHCYKPEMRDKIRKVMRFAGPRMIYTHPIMGFRHLFKKLRKTDNLG
ncbi:MAG: nitrous oxide-stimulated promoter family protein [Candidatus Thorarchaeota archaeon]